MHSSPQLHVAISSSHCHASFAIVCQRSCSSGPIILRSFCVMHPTAIWGVSPAAQSLADRPASPDVPAMITGLPGVLLNAMHANRSCHAVNIKLLLTVCAGSSQAQPSGTAQAVPQDEVFQLLQTAVYTPAQELARQSSIQQLARMVPHLQESPGAANAIAVFSARYILILLSFIPPSPILLTPILLTHTNFRCEAQSGWHVSIS